MAILKTADVSGGLIVYLGHIEPQLLAALRSDARFLVHGLATGEFNAANMRHEIRALGVHGVVTVDRHRSDRLPLIDNMVNLFIADDPAAVSEQEILRVLVPNGVALLRDGGQWRRSVKPRPTNIDEWTHYFYDSKGNAVSHDDVVAPPERLQWLGSPRWSRHHDRMSSLSAMVSSGGRIFYIIDEGSRTSILLPSRWALIARDAFNGVDLWKQPIDEWHSQLWPLKSGPTQLTRRLVAIGDSVYVTLGINAPVSMLNAASGRIIRTFEGTRGTEEILVTGGTLYALINPEPWVLSDFAPKFNTGDQKRVETEFNWDAKPRELHAIDIESGKLLWGRPGKVAPLTVAADAMRVVYYDGDHLTCLNPATGETRWQSAPAAKRKLFEYNYAPRLVLHEDMVLYAGGDGEMKGYDADTGKEAWSAPHNKSGYRSPEDLIVAGGLVWNAPTLSGKMSGAFTGRDPKTGEVRKEFPPDVATYWFHHRCYIAKATDRYLIPSRTGIEFVDFNRETWDINHWVRGACLYGILPCNGLVYAPPHNCACYPEAKLFGFNALAPGAASPHPKPGPDETRIERGPAYIQPVLETAASEDDWPTYRHDNARSGSTRQTIPEKLGQQWNAALGGRLSAITVAGGKLFVSEIDAHTVHAIDAASGRPLWKFMPGGRVDSPPTFWSGRILFGSADGWVYCVRAEDGALIWRFQAAPNERRHMAFEQLESVWPVHGSVLVENGIASFVAGRSVFLDGGMRYLRLDVSTGKKIVETVLDDRDPETGGDLQERVQTLQMPVGLNDILSSDGNFVYLRSQKFKADGTRIEIGPVSGNAAAQGGAQKGEGAHIFAPMGFLDDTWFHRSYWVYGKNFAGGHNGYYQAAKYAPAGRILVFDDENVYGYGREAKYLRWTTTLEHQLFSASRKIPDVTVSTASGAGGRAGGTGLPSVRFADTAAINPADSALTIEAWILPDGPDGVILSHGGSAQGYALALNGRKPTFYIRSSSELSILQSKQELSSGWHHVAAVLELDATMRLYINGKLAGVEKGRALIAKKPVQGLELGADSGSQVGDYGLNHCYTGLIDQFAIYHRALTADEVARNASPASSSSARPAGAVLFSSFDRGDARDDSGGETHGVLSGVDTGKGRSGAALWFRKSAQGRGISPAAARRGNAQASTSFVEHHWQRFVPLFVRAMAMAGKTILIAGPADIVNEETAFERLVARDTTVHAELREQEATLNGERGAKLLAISMQNGKLLHELVLHAPPVWDGIAIANGRVYVATIDGRILCFGRPLVL